jgi:RraA family protein
MALLRSGPKKSRSDKKETPMNIDEMRHRLARLDTACLCDANKNIRTLDPAIRPIRTDLKLIGRARTVVCKDDFLTVILALSQAEPGEVLVVDGRGGRRALAGELFATEAARKGLGGLVVDGAVRDTVTLHKVALPVYSRHIFPNAGTTKRIFETQVEVTCGGVAVRPGDILFGDEDGVVVASTEDLTRWIPIAEELQAKEDRVLDELSHGRSLLEMLNFDEHFAAISEKRESKLTFKV